MEVEIMKAIPRAALARCGFWGWRFMQRTFRPLWLAEGRHRILALSRMGRSRCHQT